jgi:hypothetical protein
MILPKVPEIGQKAIVIEKIVSKVERHLQNPR